MFAGRLILWSSASFFFLFPLSAILHRKIETSFPYEGVELNFCDQQESRGVHQPGGSDTLGICLQAKPDQSLPWASSRRPDALLITHLLGLGVPIIRGKRRVKPAPLIQPRATSPWRAPRGAGSEASGKHTGKAFWEIPCPWLSFSSCPFSGLINFKSASETALRWLTKCALISMNT